MAAAAALGQKIELILHLPKGYETELGSGGSEACPPASARGAGARAVRFSGVGSADEPMPTSIVKGKKCAMGDRSVEGARHHHVLVTHKPAILATTDKLLVLAAGQVHRPQ